MTEDELKKVELKHLKDNLKIYQDNKELVLLYEEYINKIIELFDFIMIKNEDLFYTIVFNILVEIGFFSYNNVLNDDIDDFKELSIMPGISVVNGAGVCRNISCFYKDVFKYFYHYPLTMCCFDKYSNNNEDTTIFGNHMINLTKYHDTIYGFDIMNHCLFKPISKSRLKGVDVKYYLSAKPYGDFLIRITTDLELKDNYFIEMEKKNLMLLIASKQETITKEQYEKLVSDANSFIIKRKKILRSFLSDNKKYPEEIKQKMLLLK